MLSQGQIKVLTSVKEGAFPAFRDGRQANGYKMAATWLHEHGYVKKAQEGASFPYVITAVGEMALNAELDSGPKPDPILAKKLKSYSWVGVRSVVDEAVNKSVHCVNKSGKALCKTTKEIGDQSLYKGLPKCKICESRFDSLTRMSEGKPVRKGAYRMC